MKRVTMLCAALVLTGATATGCGGRQDEPTADVGGEVTCEVTADTRVGIATGNATGVYFSLGNAYNEHLSGLAPGTLRWSWDIGLTTNTVRDQGLEFLFGLGSETFDQGGHVTSVRVAIGSRQGF